MTLRPKLLSLMLLAAVNFLAACSTDREELSRLVSPDRETIAVVVREYGGGAAGWSVLYIYLIEAEGAQQLDQPNLTATVCAEVAPTWIDSRTLQITYDSPCGITQFVNYWYRKSALRIERPHVQRIEIVLVRDPIMGEPAREPAQ